MIDVFFLLAERWVISYLPNSENSPVKVEVISSSPPKLNSKTAENVDDSTVMRRLEPSGRNTLDAFRGKSGCVSFCGLSHQLLESRKLVSSPFGDGRGSIIWILAPIGLISSWLLPHLFLNIAIEVILKDEVLAEIVASLSSEIIFYAGLAVYLSITVHVQQPYIEFSPKQWSLITGLRGYLSSAFLTMGFKVVAPLLAVYAVWPVIGFAAVVSVAPFLLGCAIQFAFELHLEKRRSSCWPILPIIFEGYRLYQINKATYFLEKLLFSMKGYKMTPIAMEKASALFSMVVLFQRSKTAQIDSPNRFFQQFLRDDEEEGGGGEVMAGVKLFSGGQAWFCTLGLPSDVVIEVNGMIFHLHKLPLMSKSRKLHNLLTAVEEDELEVGQSSEEDVRRRISFGDFPGSETFEIAAKFCYGSKIEMSAATAAPLRCAAEFLEMTDEFAGDNLISRCERFLSQTVFLSVGDSVKALKSCETLLPLAEDLGIPQRCIDAMVAGASAADARALFSWPVNDDAVAPRRNGRVRSSSSSWVDDLAMLSLPFYKRLISGFKARDPSSELIEGSLVSYAERFIPRLSRSKRIGTTTADPSPAPPEQIDILETIVTNLQPEKSSSIIITTRFLFGLLRTAIILRAPEVLRTALEKKIASQLDQATLDDLLIPSYSYLIETLYDVDAVQRILRHYMEEMETERAIIAVNPPPENRPPTSRNDSRVARLVDAFLAEVASDANLLPEKFCDIAAALPAHSRIYDDGLYRAIDIYLKAHPGMAVEEKEKVYRLMDFRKLTPEALTHVAQNERLPVRAVVQALFVEQLQLRQAVTGTISAAEEEEEEEEEAAAAVGGMWQAAARENQLLRLGMDSMMSRVQDLERECLSMRRAIEKMDRRPAARAVGPRRLQPVTEAGWGSLGRRLGCMSRMEVRDSQAVAPPKSADRQQSLRNLSRSGVDRRQ
ncbi:BTB/POZ domain-containing protein [Apostasia shenzhenica]|uniref:BTB/POZ domain-containing protein n=1 Tax=Apostasia shenzhenica TaxID=1088818 RepID=A0A2I0AZK8_9ASPA|nr:BTB/POZ domain-containing protein [Apostasia shenzhenica]